ncbi:MAG: hypothetical protein ACK5XX_06255 [Holosporales bacterium]
MLWPPPPPPRGGSGGCGGIGGGAFSGAFAARGGWVGFFQAGAGAARWVSVLKGHQAGQKAGF